MLIYLFHGCSSIVCSQFVLDLFPVSPASIGCSKLGAVLEVKLNKLAQVIAGCWVEGESRLAELIDEKHPNGSEELITDLLAGELRTSIAHASDTHGIEHVSL